MTSTSSLVVVFLGKALNGMTLPLSGWSRSNK